MQSLDLHLLCLGNCKLEMRCWRCCLIILRAWRAAVIRWRWQNSVAPKKVTRFNYVRAFELLVTSDAQLNAVKQIFFLPHITHLLKPRVLADKRVQMGALCEYRSLLFLQQLSDWRSVHGTCVCSGDIPLPALVGFLQKTKKKKKNNTLGPFTFADKFMFITTQNDSVWCYTSLPSKNMHVRLTGDAKHP